MKPSYSINPGEVLIFSSLLIILFLSKPAKASGFTVDPGSNKSVADLFDNKEGFIPLLSFGLKLG